MAQYIAEAEKVMNLIQEAIAPGKYLVDYIPCRTFTNSADE